jgi:hypothetical protein
MVLYVCFVGVFAALLLLANSIYLMTLFVNFMTFSVIKDDKLSEMRRDKAFKYIF